MTRVLVTGGTGFISTHCLIQLLNEEHEVRATLRDMNRERDTRAILRAGGARGVDERLSLFRADLISDKGWEEAVEGCEYVLHIASPYPSTAPKNEDELIIPARDGTLRVLRASRDAGVARVVLTSSFGAIGYGAEKGRTAAFTESDWTDLDYPKLQAYPKSKTIAEKEAWSFIHREGHDLELTVINPVGVLGPVLGPVYSASITLIKRMLDGATPGCPDITFGVVDVRDVASLHLKAMTSPVARNERFLATAGDFLTVRQIAQILKEEDVLAALKVSTRSLPTWLMRAIAMFDSEVKGMVPELGRRKNASNEKASRLLDWKPRSPREAVIATAKSLRSLGLLKAA